MPSYLDGPRNDASSPIPYSDCISPAMEYKETTQRITAWYTYSNALTYLAGWTDWGRSNQSFLYIRELEVVIRARFVSRSAQYRSESQAEPSLRDSQDSSGKLPLKTSFHPYPSLAGIPSILSCLRLQKSVPS